MPATFEADDHVLRWPRESFRRRSAELINAQQQSTPGWGEEVELFLDDAFDSNQPVDTFRSMSNSLVVDPWGAAEPVTQTPIPPGRRYLIDLLKAADSFPHEVQRRPYRSQRGRPDGAPITISLSATVRDSSA